MTDLTAWLLERIAADEAVVAEAGAPLGRVDSELVECDTYAYRYHIAASRVLAECSARRKIVEAVSAWKHEVVEDCWYTCAAATEDRDGGECCDDNRRDTGCDCGLDFRVRSILAPLAGVYADAPGFREEWL